MTKFIKLEDGTRVPVSEKVHRAYYKQKWREEYIERVEKKLHLSYDELIESRYLLRRNHFAPAPSPEELVEREMTLELLYSAFETLAEEEKALTEALFYEGMTEREYAESIGVPQQTMNDRKRKILAKLSKLMGGKFC